MPLSISTEKSAPPQDFFEEKRDLYSFSLQEMIFLGDEQRERKNGVHNESRAEFICQEFFRKDYARTFPSFSDQYHFFSGAQSPLTDPFSRRCTDQGSTIPISIGQLRWHQKLGGAREEPRGEGQNEPQAKGIGHKLTQNEVDFGQPDQLSQTPPRLSQTPPSACSHDFEVPAEIPIRDSMPQGIEKPGMNNCFERKRALETAGILHLLG
ncbi:hypothetical protein B0H14DRAFT_2636710 [Mycena olivaceomarginata]|nr:hypothetical protein B0H14DRAFT_2636710 [Mycena olivaceomarginata]